MASELPSELRRNLRRNELIAWQMSHQPRQIKSVVIQNDKLLSKEELVVFGNRLIKESVGNRYAKVTRISITYDWEAANLIQQHVWNVNYLVPRRERDR